MAERARVIGRAERPALIGRPGKLARVERWSGLHDGRLVVLEHRAGRIAALLGVDDPTEAWRCRLTSAPLREGHRNVWALYLPDRCLTPMGTMNRDQMGELRRQQAMVEFDAALADLGRILSGNDDIAAAFGDNPDRLLDLAGQQALLEHALQRVAAGTALAEAGFRPVADDQDLMRWVLGRPVDRLRFEAIQEPSGPWRLSCRGFTEGEAICDEATTPPEGRRGELLVPLLGMWRRACPRLSVPQGLTPAEVALRHPEALATMIPRQ
ncbi:MAG TPA: hypothetical protein PLF63_09680 [Rubrivivax sp.]|nr:hypothetical protein [Rubrivivax sp.]